MSKKFSDPSIRIDRSGITLDSSFGLSNDTSDTPKDATILFSELAYAVRDTVIENGVIGEENVIFGYNISETPARITGFSSESIHGNAVSVDASAGTITINEDGLYSAAASVSYQPNNLTPGEYVSLLLRRNTTQASLSVNVMQVPDVALINTIMSIGSSVAFIGSPGDIIDLAMLRENETGSVSALIGFSTLVVTKIDP